MLSLFLNKKYLFHFSCYFVHSFCNTAVKLLLIFVISLQAKSFNSFKSNLYILFIIGEKMCKNLFSLQLLKSLPTSKRFTGDSFDGPSRNFINFVENPVSWIKTYNKQVQISHIYGHYKRHNPNHNFNKAPMKIAKLKRRKFESNSQFYFPSSRI